MGGGDNPIVRHNRPTAPDANFDNERPGMTLGLVTADNAPVVE